MTGSRFTAPVAGYYLFVPGQEPRLLTDAEAAAWKNQPEVQTFHFEAGDTTMNSGGTLTTGQPTLTIPWRG